MILVLLDTGVRRTELVSLDLADLDLEAQRLRVLHGKGNKQRVVRFGARAREAVEDYLERYWGREPGPLFLMEASPKVGDTYRQEYYAGEAEDMATVLNVNESKTVSAGSYQEVVVTEDFTPLEPDKVEHKYFAPGVGFVMGSMVKGGSEETELVEIITD
jgi:hypothetical protein